MDGYARDYPHSLTIEAQDGGSPTGKSKAVTIAQIHISDVVIHDGRPVISFPLEDGLVITVPEVCYYIVDIFWLVEINMYSCRQREQAYACCNCTNSYLNKLGNTCLCTKTNTHKHTHKHVYYKFVILFE